MPKIPTLAICWPRFGPYHTARITACSHHLEGRVSIVGIETDAGESTYAWPETEIKERSWRHVKIHRPTSVFETLDKVNADAVTVNGWGFRDSRQVMQWASTRGRAMILMSDSRPCDSRQRWYKTWLKRRLVRVCHTGVVAGKSHQEYLSSLGMPQGRIWIGLDVVDNNHFANSGNSQRSRIVHDVIGDAPYLLSVGRFVEKKNLGRMIEAFASVHPRLSNQDTQLLVVGDGELRSELVAQVDRSGLNDRIHFLPFQSYETLPNLYRHSKAFILPSTIDQWGLVVNEAMAAGSPVLVSNACGCSSELVRPGLNGNRFDPLSVPSIGEAILDLLNTPDDQLSLMGEHSRKIIANWDLDRFALSIEHAFQESFNQKKTRSVVTGWLLASVSA